MMRSLLILALILSFTSWGFAPAPQTTPGLTLSTPYPSLEIKAGENITIDLEIQNNGLEPQVAKLEVTDLPDGWTTAFQGGGRVIHSVYVDTQTSRQFKLSLQVPESTTEQKHQFTVVARGQAATARLPLELTVSAGLPPQLAVEAELPVLKGTPNTTFNYRLKITNDVEEDLLANLIYESTDSFDVTFKTAGQEVTSVPVTAGQTKTIDVSVKATELVAAGEYAIKVHVQAGEVSAETELVAVITGQPDLIVSGLDGRLSGRANAGSETSLELIVKNTGTAPAENVRLEASPPATWNVIFEPNNISTLGPNEEMRVVARIQPPQQAVAGDYMLGVRVVPAAGSTESADFRITVSTSTVWGAVGLGLIAVALGVVALSVARFGRR